MVERVKHLPNLRPIANEPGLEIPNDNFSPDDMEKLYALLNRENNTTEDPFVHADEGNPVGQFFENISRTPLLEPKDEILLGRAIQNGKKAQAQLENEEVDTQKTTEALEGEIALGKRAKEYFELANMRLVVFEARKYLEHGLELLDLVQEGYFGLRKAVDKYNPNLQYKFSTYATWWIRQAITRAITSKGRFIIEPVHVATIRASIYALWEELGREPTLQEIVGRTGSTTSQVKAVLRAPTTVVSLDAPVGEDLESTLGDFIEDKNTPSPHDEAEIAIERKRKRKRIRDALEILEERERRVLTFRFGLDDGRERSFEEIGNEMRYTRQRIKQIADKALIKLRGNRGLEELLD